MDSYILQWYMIKLNPRAPEILGLDAQSNQINYIWTNKRDKYLDTKVLNHFMYMYKKWMGISVSKQNCNDAESANSFTSQYKSIWGWMCTTVNLIVYLTASDKTVLLRQIENLLSVIEANSVPFFLFANRPSLWDGSWNIYYQQVSARHYAQWSPSFTIHISKRHWGTLEAKLADPE